MKWWQTGLEVALRGSWLLLGVNRALHNHPIAGCTVVFIEQFMVVSWPEGPVDKLNPAVHDDPHASKTTHMTKDSNSWLVWPILMLATCLLGVWLSRGQVVVQPPSATGSGLTGTNSANLNVSSKPPDFMVYSDKDGEAIVVRMDGHIWLRDEAAFQQLTNFVETFTRSYNLHKNTWGKP